MGLETTPAHWYSTEPDGRIVCELCPRACRMKPGDRGFCFVRKNVEGQMVLDTYGKSTGFCIDPIEKKPLNHFLPGTAILSFGTAGCNLGCKFCQNWDISKSREVARLSDLALPADIAAAAKNAGCRSVAFTYNDPVIWAEYAIDTAQACREIGLKSVAVTAGYIHENARGDFFSEMDAANIDLKAFDESFYYKLTGSHLQPVLDTIEFVCNETDCWVELTNLIIPDANDSAAEIERMCQWVLDRIGPNVPIHFTAFHPDFRMNDRPRTDPATLVMAYDIARRAGLNYVYVGNVHDVARQSTYCHQCQRLLIERDWHQLGRYTLDQNQCANCGETIPGRFETRPGSWGARRQRVRIASQNQPPRDVVQIEPRPTGSGKVIEDDVRPAEDSMKSIELTELETSAKETIRKAACAMVAAAVHNQDPARHLDMLGEYQKLPINGVFVTVKRGDALRGCCGMQGVDAELGPALADSAARTARDPRMAPLSASELPYLNLSVSLLGPRRPVTERGDDREGAVQVGVHGLRIQMGQNGGLLLPQVATEQGWNAKQFLDAVCRKAGLPAGSWRSDDAQLVRFEGIQFGGDFVAEGKVSSSPPRLLSDSDWAGYQQWIRSNLVALQSGATPMYYATGLSDFEVSGIVFSVSHPRAGEQKWLQLGLKDARPIQSTLFQLTQQAANWLGAQVAATECQVQFALLDDCVHHGDSGEADLRGVACQHRGVIVTDGRRWAVRYDQDADPKSLLGEAMEMESFRGPAQIYSLRCECSARSIHVSIGPRADARFSIRNPAVAGKFYAGSDAQREREVSQLVDGLTAVEKRCATAIMVPHAGLRFSGQVAAEVWRRVEVPRRTLIIGPKHMPDGVDWAVAPHSRWQVSESAAIEGDIQLAAELAGKITGMELDAQAHAREHGIEIQLPLMLRFCPETKLTAIAMAGGGIDDLTVAAKSLANWYQTQEDPPLLVVSSDMNHYADDVENRRRDRLALDALATGDAEKLLSVCSAENISMCGQLPAALVLLTLKELGKSCSYEEIAYATSGDHGGGRDRVVGYAGVIWEE